MAILNPLGVDQTTGLSRTLKAGDTLNTGTLTPSFLNIGSATSAVATGDLAAGDGTNELFWDASIPKLSILPGSALSEEVLRITHTGIHAAFMIRNTSAPTASLQQAGIDCGFSDTRKFTLISGSDTGLPGDLNATNYLYTKGADFIIATDTTGSSVFTQALRVDHSNQSVRVYNSFNVGTGITPSTANGDIVAGDGTRELFWDASLGDLTVGGTGTASKLIYDNSTSTLWLEGTNTNHTIQCGRDLAGASLIIKTIDETLANAGSITIDAGDGGSTNGNGGSISILAGAGQNPGASGSVYITARAGGTSDGKIYFRTSTGGLAVRWAVLSDGILEGDLEGGSAIIRGANATTAATAGASLTIRGGNATTTGAGGVLDLVAGTSPSGTPGTVQVNSLPLPTVLAQVSGVNLDTVSTDPLYTVPAGRSAIVTRVVVRLTAATAAAGDAIVSVGTNASTYDDIIAATTLTGLDATTESFILIAEGNIHTATAADVITFQVDTADTGTTATASVELIGYLL